MPTVLITGANRGLGFEFTKQYLSDGWRVIACCRNPKTAKELKQLSETYGDKLNLQAVDVSKPDEIDRLAKATKGEAIDLMINNAGIYQDQSVYSEKKGERFGSINCDVWAESFRTNTMGPLKMVEALLEQLKRGEGKRIINISSLMGSVAENRDGGAYLYRTSKAALNMVTRTLAIELRQYGLTVVSFHPGWVKTDMGGERAPLQATDSIGKMRSVIARLSNKDSGKFIGYDGKEVPW